MMETFRLQPGVTTRQINRAIRVTTAKHIKSYEAYLPNDLAPNFERRRPTGKSAHYVFGMGTQLRDTLVASHDAGSDVVRLVFPNDYHGWDRANFYDRCRIAIRDELLYKSGLIDSTKIVEDNPALKYHRC